MTVVQLIKELSKYPAGMEVRVVVFLHDFPTDHVFQVQPVTSVREITVLKNEQPYVALRTGMRP